MKTSDVSYRKGKYYRSCSKFYDDDDEDYVRLKDLYS